jgi:hypothetical protein
MMAALTGCVWLMMIWPLPVAMTGLVLLLTPFVYWALGDS